MLSKLWAWLKSLIGEIPVPADVEPPFNAGPAPSPPPIVYPPPSAPPTITPVPGVEDLQTFQAILSYNNGLSFFAATDVWSEPTKGVVVHKINETQALAISTRIKPSVEAHNLDLSFALGCLAIESTLDPECENGNLGPGESNTANDPLGYDMGIAQLKLRYLVGVAPGVTDAASAKAFAFNVDQAIPYFCSIMAEHVDQAKALIAANTSSVPDPRLSNPLLLGTGIYNFGLTGMTTIYESGQFPSHCSQVLDLTNSFAKMLGMVSVFADLTA